MANEIWDSVDEYLKGKLIGSDKALDACASNSTAQGLPEIQVSPLQGQLLFMLARSVRARRILELGTLGGYSTISLARAVAPDGVVITCELEQHHAEVARDNLSRAGLSDGVTIMVGTALDSLKTLIASKTEPFDFIFIDADKANMPEYFSLSMELSRPGTLMMFDNVVREGEVANAQSEDPSVIGVRRLVEMLSTDSRVDATAIQTVGIKGYDGFAFALVNG